MSLQRFAYYWLGYSSGCDNRGCEVMQIPTGMLWGNARVVEIIRMLCLMLGRVARCVRVPPPAEVLQRYLFRLRELLLGCLG